MAVCRALWESASIEAANTMNLQESLTDVSYCLNGIPFTRAERQSEFGCSVLMCLKLDLSGKCVDVSTCTQLPSHTGLSSTCTRSHCLLECYLQVISDLGCLGLRDLAFMVCCFLCLVPASLKDMYQKKWDTLLGKAAKRLSCLRNVQGISVGEVTGPEVRNTASTLSADASGTSSEPSCLSPEASLKPLYFMFKSQLWLTGSRWFPWR